jgi:peroxiredoxin
MTVPAMPAWGQKMPAMDPQRGAHEGNLAPAFSLKDLNGTDYRLQEMLGKEKVVHLAFWATWCVPCVAEIPVLRDMYDRYHERGLEVLGVVVPMSQTRDGVRAFSKKHGINYPVLWDDEEKTTSLYRVASLPRNFLIGRDGIIHHAGVELPEDLESLIESLLEDGEPPPAGP